MGEIFWKLVERQEGNRQIGNRQIGNRQLEISKEWNIYFIKLALLIEKGSLKEAFVKFIYLFIYGK